MKHLLLILFFICSLSACDRNPGASKTTGPMDWTLFRGDPSLSGYTATKLPNHPALLWIYKGDTRTVSSPIVHNGSTYWCDNRGYIRGVNDKGELVFEYDLKTAVEATPMIYDSLLYVGRIDGFMTALSLTEKEIVWNYETMGQISASPNLLEFTDRKTIVFGSYDNYLYCVDAKTGEEISRFESGYYLNGAAALWKEHVIFGGCDSWLRIIDCKKGIPTDSLLLDAYVPASPAIVDDCCYIGDYSGNVYELLLKEGKIEQHKKILSEEDENGSFVSVPAVSGDAIYVYSGNRNIHAISRRDKKLKWKYMLKGNVGESSPVVCDTKTLVCTKTGIVSILDADKGTLLWEYDTGEQIVGSPAVIKDHFMVLTAKGTLLCFGRGAV